MAIRKKILNTMKAAIFVVVGSGFFVLTGCSLPPTVQDQPATDSTSTASPMSTPIKKMETVTVVTTDDNPTPTLTPMPSPAAPEVSTTIEDTFIDNRNNWHTDSTLLTIDAGTYRHKIECPNSNASPHCGTFIKMPFIFPRNFRMEIDATIMKSSTGASVMVAFEVRRKAEYYYINYFITDGQYQISRISEFGIYRLIPETGTDFIKATAGDTNRIGIEMKDTSLTPLINGHEVAPVHDGKIPNAGDSYLVILIARGHSAEVQFDNLIVQGIQ